MSRTFKRPAISLHKKLREDPEFRSRVEKNKKKENKNKHPKREIDWDLELTWGPPHDEY